MKDTKPIIERILGDAESFKQKTIKDAEAYAEATKRDATTRADECARREEAALKIDEKNIASRRALVASIDAKKIILAARRRALEASYVLAEEKLSSLSEDEQLSLIDKLVSECAEKGDTAILSSKCKIAEEKFCALPSFKKYGVSIAKNRGDFSGGVILSNAVCDKDLSYRTLVLSSRDKTEQEITKTLCD